MPAKRTKAKQRQARITPEAVAAYRERDWLTLHRLLGLKPWEASPIDATGDSPWPTGSAGERTWDKAVRLRAELEAALAEARS